jgi:hypothetical protein
MPTAIYGLVPLLSLLGMLQLIGPTPATDLAEVRQALAALLPLVVVFTVAIFLLGLYANALPEGKRLGAGLAFVALIVIYALVSLPLGPLQPVALGKGVDLTLVFLAYLPVAVLSALKVLYECRPRSGGGAGGSLGREFTIPLSRRARGLELTRAIYVLTLFLPLMGLYAARGLGFIPVALWNGALAPIAFLGGAAAVCAFLAGSYLKGSRSRLISSLAVIALVCLELVLAGNWGNLSVPIQGMGADIHAGWALLLLVIAVAIWSLVAIAEYLSYRAELVAGGYQKVEENSGFLYHLVGKD